MNRPFAMVVAALVITTSTACGHFQRMDLPEHVSRVERKTEGTAVIPNVTTPISDHAPTDTPRLPADARTVVPPA